MWVNQVFIISSSPHLLSRNVTLLIFEECSEGILKHCLRIILLTGKFSEDNCTQIIFSIINLKANLRIPAKLSNVTLPLPSST